jgi:hypothetical protein
MAERDNGDESARRSWWTDALDPAENLRALTDVQEFGRRAVEDLADRILGSSKAQRPLGPRALPEAELDDLVRALRTDAGRAADMWVGFLDNLARLLGIVATQVSRPAADGAASTTVVLEATPPGGTTTGVFWVHNTSAASVRSVRPHCAPLRSHDGCELATDTITFDPPQLDPLPPRSSCGIEMALAVPTSAVPGTYLSVILATNLPGLYLPLHVTVRAEDE